MRRGPALTIGELEGTFVRIADRAGSSGVDGAAVLNRSELGAGGPLTTPATLSSSGGKVCMAGHTVIVPGMNFTEYWGAQIMLFLAVQPANAGDAGAALDASAAATVDAGGDAGADLLYLPWDPANGNVIGVSFVVEGNDASLPCGGLPPVFRLESWPDGGDPNVDIYCKDLSGLVSGGVQDVLFSQVVRQCWEPGGRGILEEPRPASFTGELIALQWLVPADEQFSYAFDLCISEIRPILGE